MNPTDMLWREIAAYVTVRRTISSLVEPPSTIEIGGALVNRHGFSALFRALADAAQQSDEVKVNLGAEALTFLLGSNEVLQSLDDSASIVPSIVAALQSGFTPIEKLGIGFLKDVACGRIQTRQVALSDLYSLDIIRGLLSQMLHGDDKISIADAAADVVYAMCGGKLSVSTGSLYGRPQALMHGPAPSPVQMGLIVQQISHMAAQPQCDPATDSILYTRVMALVARICGVSDTAFEACESSGLVRRLLSGAWGQAAPSDVPLEQDAQAGMEPDPLVQLLVIDLLKSFAGSARGAATLISSGTYTVLLDMAAVPVFHPSSSSASGNTRVDAEEGRMEDPLLGNNAMAAAADCYAAACRPLGVQHTAVRSMRAALLPGLFICVRAACSDPLRDMGRTAAALAALGAVLAADRTALVELLSQPWQSTVREWLELAGSSQPELRHACLATLASIVHGAADATSAVDQDQVESETAPYRSLVEQVGPCCGRGLDTLDVLRGVMGNVADPDSRYAAYDLLTAIISMPGAWGLRKVLSSPGMLPSLLDRGAEQSKEGKEWRFGVLSAAARHPALSLLGEELAGRIRTWVARGPYAADMAGPAMTHMSL